jgi:hypothetical protein
LILKAEELYNELTTKLTNEVLAADAVVSMRASYLSPAGNNNTK